MQVALDILRSSWDLLLEAGVYVLLGLLVAGMLKTFLNPSVIANHLGRGRFWPVLKAALLGMPLPL